MFMLAGETPLQVDEADAIRDLLSVVRKQLRMWVCRLSGGHELTHRHMPGRIYQGCLCGYETPGWILKEEK